MRTAPAWQLPQVRVPVARQTAQSLRPFPLQLGQLRWPSPPQVAQVLSLLLWWELLCLLLL